MNIGFLWSTSHLSTDLQLSYNSKAIVLETWYGKQNKVSGKKLIDKDEEEKILKELENSDIVLDRDKLKGIFSDSESDSDCDTNMTSDSDDVNNDNFYKLTTVKGKNHDKEFDI